MMFNTRTLLFLFVTIFLPFAHCRYSLDKYFIIRNQKSGLVLDASAHVVTLQHYTGFPAQLWKLEHAGPAIFYIVNKGNGKVLDIQGGARSGHNLITYYNNGDVNQQWYINSDGTIVSIRGDLAVDIRREKYEAGTNLMAFPKHGKANQLFDLQSQ